MPALGYKHTCNGLVVAWILRSLFRIFGRGFDYMKVLDLEFVNFHLSEMKLPRLRTADTQAADSECADGKCTDGECANGQRARGHG